MTKTVKINKGYCKSCGLCVEVCPLKSLSVGESFNKSGFHPVELTGKCIGCGKCYLICPDFAIEVTDDE
jgi:2-oxoglutarate ferredoxin oxidoreductase subunit delta